MAKQVAAEWLKGCPVVRPAHSASGGSAAALARSAAIVRSCVSVCACAHAWRSRTRASSSVSRSCEGVDAYARGRSSGRRNAAGRIAARGVGPRTVSAFSASSCACNACRRACCASRSDLRSVTSFCGRGARGGGLRLRKTAAVFSAAPGCAAAPGPLPAHGSVAEADLQHESVRHGGWRRVGGARAQTARGGLRALRPAAIYPRLFASAQLYVRCQLHEGEAGLHMDANSQGGACTSVAGAPARLPGPVVRLGGTPAALRTPHNRRNSSMRLVQLVVFQWFCEGEDAFRAVCEFLQGKVAARVRCSMQCQSVRQAAAGV